MPEPLPPSNRAWKIISGLVLFLLILAYSPLVLSPGESGPEFFGMPRTLWAGLLLYIVIVVLTWLATRVHPDNQSDES